LVSVVVPVYNTADYLAECLESALAQTYQHWELVVADNRSTDRSRDIADGFARRDARVRVVTADTHIPQVPNYNRAVTLMSTESRYCKVLQADDWMFPECLARMVEVAEADPDIGIVGGYTVLGDYLWCQGLEFPSRSVPGRDVCRRHLLKGGSVFGSPTSLMYRSDLVRARHPFYSETSMFEDTAVCYDILEHARYGFVHQVLSYARVDQGSMSARLIGYNAWLLHEVQIVHQYGPKFLTAGELRDRWGDLTRRYYRFLGGAALRGRPAEFWRYHREGLAEVGIGLSRGRIVSLALSAALDLALNPKSTVENLLGLERN
jgi:glycosyltransferase involved in cell wall biosynthesis